MPIKYVIHPSGLREEIAYGKIRPEDEPTFGIGPPVRMSATNQVSAHRRGKSTVEVKPLPKSAS